ncbi:hypothetical protein L915_19947 [Phytophthora nicotianae]|uniref:Uncharacterized protein n=1 Tax=Phytophthora nicotianae TaxID=4792 RepID=W2HZD8_PHYNI|nr:hypothetical protein L915_19947 [Phytophthora nicotianae]ETL26518.1 hypothetical protein L916_19827 [Phytophthora nicotianae]ETM32984.1 hypothetical protein L914_19725 [Phytophthora nicotianae]
MAACEQFVRQFLDIPIVHRTPNARFADPDPAFALWRVESIEKS